MLMHPTLSFIIRLAWNASKLNINDLYFFHGTWTCVWMHHACKSAICQSVAPNNVLNKFSIGRSERDQLVCALIFLVIDVCDSSSGVLPRPDTYKLWFWMHQTILLIQYRLCNEPSIHYTDAFPFYNCTWIVIFIFHNPMEGEKRDLFKTLAKEVVHES